MHPRAFLDTYWLALDGQNKDALPSLLTVPTQFIDQVQPLDTWPDFRARLMKQGVREAPRPNGPPPTYCAAGN